MKKTMKIEYRRHIDSETAPWQLLTNIDELLWNGVYALRVTDDNGSHNLPFRFKNDDTVTLVVKDHSHEGMLEDGRTIVQTITRVERSTGAVFTHTRTRHRVNGNHQWSTWTLATESGSAINIPQATISSLGGIIVGEGLIADENGKLSIDEKSIDEKKLSNELNNKINKIEAQATLADTLVINDGIILGFGALIENSEPYTGTNYCAHSNKILANGETLAVNTGYTISAFKIFEGEQEILYSNKVENKEILLDNKGHYYQFEFRKEKTATFTNEELSNVVKSFLRKPFNWKSNDNIDNFTSQGTYNISGYRTGTTDNLPINNTGKFNARLTVLAAGDCITQLLTLLNVGGGDGNIYVRTKQAGTWEPWGKLQTNIEVGAIGLGQSRNFDHLTDNGIYSGANIYSTGTGDNGYPLTAYETFVLIVINGYLTGGGVSQLKYSLLPDGATCVATRTMQDNEWSEWHDISTVDKEINAYSVNPVQNKTVAQALQDAIEEGRKLAKRDLFIAAGAEYNDSGADKTKTTPWGETVTHKAGHYYLNGLGDITEEQMIMIYNMGKYWQSENAQGFGSENVRTNLSPTDYLLYYYKAFNLSQAFNSATIEAISLVAENYIGSPQGEIRVSNINFFTQSAQKLKTIIGVIDTGSMNINNAIINGSGLETLYLKNIKASVSIHNAKSLKIDSVLYLINYAKPSSAITITLHPDAYARLKDDTEIVAALEAQPLISLVSA